MRILTLDIGSSSVKAAIASGNQFTGHVRIPFPTSFDGPKAEISAPRLLQTVFQAARRALAGSSKSVDAISFCTFSPGLIITDKSFRPVAPIITHADRRSTAIAGQLVSHHGKSFWLKHAGNLPYPGSIAASTLAFLRHNAQFHGLFRPGYRVGQVSSFITHALTGQWTIDPSQAAFLGLYDIRTNGWSEALCRAITIDPAALPHIHVADAIQGTLTASAARQLHLTAGIPIVGGFVDTSAAIIQTPMHPGQLAHSAGSTDVLAMCLTKPKPAEGILTRPVGTGAILPDRWLAVRTIASAGSGIQWARETFFRDLTEASWQRTVKSACRHAKRVEAHPDQAVTCRPTFAGERAAMQQPAGADFSNIRLGTPREALLTALARGLIAESAHNFHLLEKIQRPAKTIYSMGHASALGAAMHAAWPGTHTFRTLPNDSLRGLALLAQHTLNA